MSILTSVRKEFYEVKNNVSFELLKSIRRGKIRTILIVSVLMSGLFYLIPILSGSDFPETSLEFISNILTFISFVFILFALFLGADAINREHANKTDLLIYPLPQRRSNVISAKFFGSLLVSWLGLIFYYGLISIMIIYIYGTSGIPDKMITSILMSLLYMSTVLAFSFFLSSTINSPATSMTVTFFGIQILLPLISLLLSLAEIDTDWIFVNYASLVTDVLQLPSSSFGPTLGTDINFNYGIVYLTIQTLLFYFATLFFGTRKEVGA